MVCIKNFYILLQSMYKSSLYIKTAYIKRYTTSSLQIILEIIMVKNWFIIESLVSLKKKYENT